MDTLPLPPRPSLAQYKKRAKGLVTATQSSDADAVRAWAREWLETLARLLEVPITPFVQGSFDRAIGHLEARVREKIAASHSAGAKFALADAQFLIANAHGFASWADFTNHLEEFTNHLEGVSRKDGEGWEFEAAADAVVTGDLTALESLLHRHPELIRARSTRIHRATLLHYVAANGVEDFRQKTPPNAVAVAKLLLDAGAEVDALANTYGGDKAQTTMNLLVSSAHPAGAGLQAALVETLLDFGAAINGLEDDESPLMTALAFGYSDTAETLARRGARIDNVVAAAALGREDLVRRFVVDARTLNPGVPLVAPRWFRLPNEAKRHIELACLWACNCGRTAIVEFLLDTGVDSAAKDDNKVTLLHCAAANGDIELVKRLLKRGAPLEAENKWGGTVLDSTVHDARHEPRADVDYLAVIELLIAAGANTRAVGPFPTGIDAIDDVLRRHGARPN